MDAQEKLENMRFSEFSNIFFNSLTAMFGQNVKSEEDAMFSKILIDHIMNTIKNCSELGLSDNLRPIANYSLWQGALEGDETFFTFRKENIKSSSLDKLSKMMQEAFNAWCNINFKDVEVVDTVTEDGGIKWNEPKKNKEE